ncbi:MAG TPA: citrate (Si)-synthase [Chloroflexi bacterium]|nr:citrate (Si)-synthase [Chloroflexota bacterium]
MLLKERLAAEIPAWRDRQRKLAKEYGDVVVDQVHMRQLLGGLRGVKALVTDISYVDPYEGIRFRGHTIPEVLEKLPKPAEGDMPYVGGLYWLLLTGDFPTKEEALSVEEEWKKRMALPEHIFDVLKAFPKDAHPMTMFAAAVLALQPESEFARRYKEGMKKTEYWDPMLEDALSLTAKLPAIAAYIYRLKYKDGKFIAPDPNLDWGANFAHMMGVENPEYKNLSRLYFILHSDHESGNVSAHTTYLVSSALSDIYYSFSAAMDGLAGPLHGLANQNCLYWLMGVKEKFGGVPTHEQMRQYAWDTLNSGQVIPGYGHAVLRRTDPRYKAQFEFALEHMPDDPLFQTAKVAYEVIPDVLKEHGKAKNPWPNVDALSGTLQQHYGVKESDFYTVMFGVGRALGVTANTVWARALGHPIERPKSVTTAMLEEEIKDK